MTEDKRQKKKKRLYCRLMIYLTYVGEVGDIFFPKKQMA